MLCARIKNRFSIDLNHQEHNYPEILKRSNNRSSSLEIMKPVLAKPISKVPKITTVKKNQETTTENPYLDLTIIKTISEKLEEDEDFVNI